jgi:hypothetical protein
MNTDEGAKSGSGQLDNSGLGRHAFTDFIRKLTSRLPLLTGVGETLFSVLLIIQQQQIKVLATTNRLIQQHRKHKNVLF